VAGLVSLDSNVQFIFLGDTGWGMKQEYMGNVATLWIQDLLNLEWTFGALPPNRGFLILVLGPQVDRRLPRG
jgi:hypothetical protein